MEIYSFQDSSLFWSILSQSPRRFLFPSKKNSGSKYFNFSSANSRTILAAAATTTELDCIVEKAGELEGGNDGNLRGATYAEARAERIALV